MEATRYTYIVILVFREMLMSYRLATHLALVMLLFSPPRQREEHPLKGPQQPTKQPPIHGDNSQIQGLERL